MVFPLIMYRCDNWTIKKAEHQWIDATVLERLLRMPWTTRRSNQSNLKEINSEYSLEGLMLKQKLQYFGHLMWRPNSMEKTLMLEKLRPGEGVTEDEMVRSPTQWTWIWSNSRRYWMTRQPRVLQSMGVTESDTTYLLNNSNNSKFLDSSIIFI